jgi:hypothetical protein
MTSYILTVLKSHYAPRAGLRATDISDNRRIDRMETISHVNTTYYIGNSSVTYPFRVFPNLQPDMFFGGDLMVHLNSNISDRSKRCDAYTDCTPPTTPGPPNIAT